MLPHESKPDILKRSLRGLFRPISGRPRRRTCAKLLRLELLEERANPAGLVAAYAFDEGINNLVSDSSGSGNSGTISNAVWSTAGKYGNALSFNGTNALVTISDSASLHLSTGMTLEAWVRPTAVASQWQDVIYKGPNDNYYLEATSSSSYPAMGGSFASTPLVGTSPLAANTWSHLAATYDGARMRLYVNGVEVSSRAQTGTIAPSTGPLTIGGDGLYGQYFAGLIDEVRVYNRALTASEIHDDMTTPIGSPTPIDPSTVGQWSAVMNWPLVAVNMVQMNNGKILMWDGGWNLCQGSESVRVWDPATNIFTPVPIPDPNGLTDIFCSAQTVLDDGRVLIVGGHECNIPGWLGQDYAYIFNPTNNQWTFLPSMQYRRWYPTVTALPDGRAIVIGGGDRNYTSGEYSRYPEIYNPQTNTWTTITNGSQVIPNYAFNFVLPDGKVLVAGSDEAPMATYSLNVAAQTWTVVDPTVINAGSAVMYEPGKVMKAGGSYITGDQAANIGIPSIATTYVLDMTQGSHTWQQTASMAFPRSHLNLTILPDGSVAATGGSSDISGESNQYGVLPAEIWSPVTKTWTTMASAQTPRMYHSTALLLPDGRVLSAGGGRDDPLPTDYLNAEIYSPPYLFKGARPTITDAPTAVGYGSSFFVQTPDAANIASVSLIRNGSVTHGVDMDQRFVPLTFTKGTGGLNVQAPANANLAPPGYYMLFIVDTNGVPSIAPFVRVAAGVSTPSLPGDYNANQAVDAADSVLWRKRLNTSTTLPNDTTPGNVAPADYTVWTSHFGTSNSAPGQGAGSDAAIMVANSGGQSSAEATATLVNAKSKEIRTASLATDVHTSKLRSRQAARLHGVHRHASSQLTAKSLLLASLRNSLEHDGEEANSSTVEISRDKSAQEVSDASFLKVLDNVFARLGDA
jgi:hypothetical protein